MKNYAKQKFTMGFWIQQCGSSKLHWKYSQPMQKQYFSVSAAPTSYLSMTPPTRFVEKKLSCGKILYIADVENSEISPQVE